MRKDQAEAILKRAQKDPDVTFSSERGDDGKIVVAVIGHGRRVVRRDDDITIASAKAYEAHRAGCVA